MNKMQHAISWFEIPTTDFSRARKFYESIFDITMEQMEFPNGLKMAIFPTQDEGISGSLVHYPDFYKTGSEGPLVYLNAGEDLQVVLDRVEPNGGKMVVPKTQISEERGYMAVFIDSEGNRVALFSRG